MRSSMYVNEFAPGAVLIDLSATPREILDGKKPLGYAYRATLGHLGLDNLVHNKDGSIGITGSLEIVRKNLPNLRANIGTIATGAARLADEYAVIERDPRYHSGMLRAAIERAQEMPDDLGFDRVAAGVTQPFAEEVNDDGLSVVYDAVAPWKMTPEQRATYEEELSVRIAARQGHALQLQDQS